MATNTGFKGVDVRQTGTALLFRAFLQSSAGALVTSGTTTLKLYQLMSDGTLQTYDFGTNAFTAGTVTTLTASMNYEKADNGAVDTGIWTYALSTLTGLTVGSILLAHVNNSGASPADQVREIQWGSDQGDLLTIATGAAGQADLQCAPDWAKVQNAASTVGLSATTISAVNGSVGSILGVAFPANFASLAIDSGGDVKVQGAIKKNQALAGFPFYMALSTDHVSPGTGKAITSTVSLNGAAFVATANAAAEIGAGWYEINLAATDLNAATVALSFAAAGCDTTILTIATQP